MTALKPAELARARLAKRTRDHIALINKTTPKSMLKSPSQKKSERAKAKELKRAGVKIAPAPVPSDCRNCPSDPFCRYNRDLSRCPENSMVVRCSKCGQKVRIRLVLGEPWEMCPVCQERKQ